MAWPSNGSQAKNGEKKAKRPIRIAGASGGVFDRFRSIEDFAADSTIDVIFGDWINEISMAFRGSESPTGNSLCKRKKIYHLKCRLSML